MALEYKHAIEQMQGGCKLHLARRLEAGDGLEIYSKSEYQDSKIPSFRKIW